MLITQSSLTLCDPIVCQAPLSMGFSRQYWSGLPFPSPRDLAGPGHYSQILYHLSHQGSDRINKRFYIARNFRHRFSFLLLQPSGHGDTWPGAGTEHKVCLGLQENEALIRERRDNPSKPSVILDTERADEKKLEGETSEGMLPFEDPFKYKAQGLIWFWHRQGNKYLQTHTHQAEPRTWGAQQGEFSEA